MNICWMTSFWILTWILESPLKLLKNEWSWIQRYDKDANGKLDFVEFSRMIESHRARYLSFVVVDINDMYNKNYYFFINMNIFINIRKELLALQEEEEARTSWKKSRVGKRWKSWVPNFQFWKIKWSWTKSMNFLNLSLFQLWNRDTTLPRKRRSGSRDLSMQKSKET